MEKNCTSIINCNQERNTLFEKKGYQILECKKCGHRYSDIVDVENHLDTVYSNGYFFEGNEGYPNYLEEKEMLYKSGLKYAKIVSKYASPGRVLDVGCAAGFYLKGFEKSGWSCLGIEPNETMASYGRNELNLEIVTGGLETFKSDQKFDLVNLIEVIGSFYDLDKAMLNISQLLNKDGLVLVESWDMKSRVARFFGKSWHEYCPPSVTNWFSDKTLTDLFSYYGFEFVAKGRPSKQIKGKHALAIIGTNSPKFILKTRILNFLNRVIGGFTLNYPPMDLKWYIFKKL